MSSNLFSFHPSNQPPVWYTNKKRLFIKCVSSGRHEWYPGTPEEISEVRYRWVPGTEEISIWVPMGTGYRPNKKLWVLVGTGYRPDKKLWVPMGTGYQPEKNFWVPMGTGYRISFHADPCVLKTT